MNSKQRRTLKLVFDNPVRGDVKWRDIESLLSALGAEISEGSGSRIRIVMNGIRMTFHRPHPRPDTDKGAIKSVRRFLEEAEVDHETHLTTV